MILEPRPRHDDWMKNFKKWCDVLVVTLNYENLCGPMRPLPGNQAFLRDYTSTRFSLSLGLMNSGIIFSWSGSQGANWASQSPMTKKIEEKIWPEKGLKRSTTKLGWSMDKHDTSIIPGCFFAPRNHVLLKNPHKRSMNKNEWLDRQTSKQEYYVYDIIVFVLLSFHFKCFTFRSNKIRTQICCFFVFACTMEVGHLPRSRAVMLAGRKVLAKYEYFTNLSLK